MSILLTFNFESGRVRYDSGKLTLPEPLGHGLTLGDTGPLTHTGDLDAGVLVEGAVGLSKAGADEEDVALVKLQALLLGNGLDGLDSDAVGGEVVDGD